MNFWNPQKKFLETLEFYGTQLGSHSFDTNENIGSKEREELTQLIGQGTHKPWGAPGVVTEEFFNQHIRKQEAGTH